MKQLSTAALASSSTMAVLVAMTMMACVLPAGVAAVDTRLPRYFEWLRQTDNSIFAGGVISGSVNTLIDTDATTALGWQDYLNEQPMFLDNSFRMNTLSEVLVGVAVQQLVDLTILPSLDAPIPTTFLPRGVTNFYNPKYASVSITLGMLMKHTSTISEAKFLQDYLKTTPNEVTTLRAFVEGFFLVSTTGGYQTAQDIWSDNRPGDTTAYSYSRANTALLGYIVEQAVIQRPNLVSSASKTVGAYIQETVLTPLGMSNTFVRTVNGNFPTGSYPSGADIWGKHTVIDLSSAGTALTMTSIHPAYIADYMYYTSLSDLHRLVRALFLSGNAAFTAIGEKLKMSSFEVPTTSARLTQVRQGLNLVELNGPEMCAYALASQVVTTCPLTSQDTIWGQMSVGAHSMVGFFCTDTASSVNLACTTVSLSFYETGSSRKSLEYILGLAAAALQVSLGSTTATQYTTAKDKTELYGLWVFFGVLGICAFVLVASYFTEYVIQPAPLSAGVPVPQSFAGGGGGGGYPSVGAAAAASAGGRDIYGPQ